MTTAYSKKLNPSRTPKQYANGGEISDESQWRGGAPADTPSTPMERFAAPSLSIESPEIREMAALDSAAPSPGDMPERRGTPVKTERRAQTKSKPAPAVKRPDPDYSNEGRGRAAPPKRRMFAESRAATKKFDEGVKAAAIRNRESAAEVERESRRGSRPDPNEKKKVLSMKGVNSKTMLPQAYANGGLIGKKTASSSRATQGPMKSGPMKGGDTKVIGGGRASYKK